MGRLAPVAQHFSRPATARQPVYQPQPVSVRQLRQQLSSSTSAERRSAQHVSTQLATRQQHADQLSLDQLVSKRQRPRPPTLGSKLFACSSRGLGDPEP